MKFSRLIAFSLFMTLNATAVEISNIAPPSLVEEYYDYCSETRPDYEGNNYILKCINTELIDGGFDTFSSYSELVAHMNKEDNE